MNLEKDTICMDKKFYLDNIQHFKKNNSNNSH